MNRLPEIVKAIESFDSFVHSRVQKARTDSKFAATLRRRWKEIHGRIPVVETPTGLKLPRVALPETEAPEEIARFLFGEGLPGEFPFVNAAYPDMYLAPLSNDGPTAKQVASRAEEPTRLFAGLGLAEDTNRRFHYLTQHQPSIRLSTAFDGPTLY